MKRIWFASVCVFLIIGFWGMSIGQTFAEEQGAKERLKGESQVRDKLAGKNREEIRDLIDSLRIVKMTQALDLSEEQTIKVFTKMGQIEKEKENSQKKMRESMHSLRKLVDSGAGEEEIKKAVEDMKNLRTSIRDRDEALSRHLEGILSVGQQAKYILFIEDFQKDVRKMIEHTRDLQSKKGDWQQSPHRFEKKERLDALPSKDILPEKIERE